MIESKFLKDNLQNIQKLMDLAPLKNFETKSLRQLLQLSKIREYEDSERIIQEGAADPWLYFLLSGKVRIKKAGVTIVVLDKVGEFFGEMRILDGLNRSASVFAEGKTICLAVDTSATGRLASDTERANFLLLLYRMFSEYISIRLRITNEELVKAKKKAIILAKQLKAK
ncbi:MAG: cyclic nucleotide-binding domain-containing protein [Deltaproteobacteria bacterium]|nr:MAG: cyclic nucleotide-binding domain-containing protein [Deltaproteobacteria bacterium]